MILAAAGSPAFAQDEWKPIDPADLALKAAVVEKGADAEAIFWEVRVSDEIGDGIFGTAISNYVRIKVFSERGRESQSKVDIPYFASWKVEAIAARTIKADGTIVELKKEDVFERIIVKANDLKINAKSFVIPGVEPGSIIEYRWKERHAGEMASYLRLPFQRDVPVQFIKYYIRPFPYSRFGMRAQTFNGVATPFVKEKDDFHSVTMSNVPAFREEPHMPPEASVRPWMLVYYTPDENLEGDAFWKLFGTRVYEFTKARMKVSDEVKRTAAATIGNAATPEQKLEKLFEFCRSTIKNTDDDASGITAEARLKLKENKSPADTLKRGMGTGTDIHVLFAALASAAGFDARIVHVGDRSDNFFDKTFPDPYFIRSFDIGVKIGDQWRFYGPASTYVPHGMLRWQDEYQQALVSDPKDPIWVSTPLSPPEKSQVKRSARLTLSEDGTLEGDVRIEYYGHQAVGRKEADDDNSPPQREEILRHNVKAQMSTAELSSIQIENVTDPIKPFVYSYHIRVPGYAQRTARRLFLQPAFFQHGVGPVFAASARKFDIYFNYPWSEQDEVSIELPAGFSLDHVDPPTALSKDEASHYKPTLTTEGRAVVYKRHFSFGGKNSILFPVEEYVRLKTYFDKVHQQDNHTVTLISNAK